MLRSLGRVDLTCLGLNAIVGSGIFLLPDDLYRELGVWSPLAFLTCGLGLLPIAWCYAQAGRLCDESGGPYVYARRAFGRPLGFAVGWMCFANSVFSFAAVAAAAAAYGGRLWPGLAPPALQKVLAVTVIAGFAALNYRGAKPGARAVNGFTVAKFAVLALLIAALAPQFKADVLSGAGDFRFGQLGQATFIALFAAQGFEVAPVPAGETRAPQRDVPFAVLSSLMVASVLYIVVQLSLVGSGADLAQVSDTPLADAAVAVAPGLAIWITMGGLVSTLGFVAGSALGTPRYLYAIARAGQLPAALSRLHPKYASPHLAVLGTAACAAVCVLPFDYRALIGMSNVAVGVQYLVTCLAVSKFGRTVNGSEQRRLGRWMTLLMSGAGASVSLWIFSEASLAELLWACASLTLGAGLLGVHRWYQSAGN